MEEETSAAYLRFLSGENEALTAIVSRYNRPLVRYINDIVRNPFDAEDLAAETFLFLLVKKPRLRKEESFHLYLFRVAHNKAVDYLRKKTRQGSVFLEEEENLFLSEEKQLWQGLLLQQQQAQVHQALRSLHPLYAELLYLLYFEELTGEQIAEILGKTKKQLANLTYRAKQALKTRLETEGFSYEDD